MHPAEFILYVRDQPRARDFYRSVLAADPVLDVEGMTEFDVGGATLGLMPTADAEVLLSLPVTADGSPRCEVYLRRHDSAMALRRAVQAGGRVIDEMADRSWGERVGYVLDLDGHVLALAVMTGLSSAEASQPRSP